MVYCVGLTGGIATGKSSVAALFAELGVDVFNADTISRDLTSNNKSVLDSIVDHFGKDILNTKGELNRMLMRDIIFSNASERKWLENLLHPLIRQKLEELVLNSKTPYCIVEIPLLINKVAYPYLNKILVITSLPEIQIARVMKRDQSSREHALSIINVQPNLELRLQNADEILINDGNLSELKHAIIQLHHKFLHDASINKGN